MDDMQRRALLRVTGAAVVGLWTVAPGAAVAQAQSSRRLGVLLFDRAESWAFLRRDLGPALARLGWVEGRNLSSDWRFADGDAARLPGLAQALLRGGADALLTRGTPATRALQQATSTVPIVTGVGDPVGSGFAASLAAPGGNITGLSYAFVETAGKQLELLREMVPGLAHLHVLIDASRGRFAAEAAGVVARVAQAQGLLPKVELIAGIDAFRATLRAARAPGRNAAFVFAFGAAIDSVDLTQALLQAGVPAVFDQRAYVADGGLMSYRLDWDDQTRSTAVQLDKVLRGVSAAQIPFELPTRTEFVINAGTAKALGLVIPTALRMRAEEVIE